MPGVAISSDRAAAVIKRGIRVLTLAASVLVSTPACATIERLRSVSQPIEIDGSLVICTNAYVSNLEGAGAALLLTAAENCVRVQGPEGFQNSNAAFLAGLEIRPAPRMGTAPVGEDWWPLLSGDTLRVVLDASKLKAEPAPFTSRLPKGADPKRFEQRRLESHRRWQRALLEITVRCMIENAARDPRARYLAIEIAGPDEFKDLAGIHALKSALDSAK